MSLKNSFVEFFGDTIWGGIGSSVFVAFAAVTAALELADKLTHTWVRWIAVFLLLVVSGRTLFSQQRRTSIVLDTSGKGISVILPRRSAALAFVFLIVFFLSDVGLTIFGLLRATYISGVHHISTPQTIVLEGGEVPEHNDIGVVLPLSEDVARSFYTDLGNHFQFFLAKRERVRNLTIEDVEII